MNEPTIVNEHQEVPAWVMERIVEVASKAPSVHNTQPWRWRGGGHTLELYADRTRQLARTDPLGRNLTISCGAALHHAQVAAGALGWGPAVIRHPDPDRPDLLARMDRQEFDLRLGLLQTDPGPLGREIGALGLPMVTGLRVGLVSARTHAAGEAPLTRLAITANRVPWWASSSVVARSAAVRSWSTERSAPLRTSSTGVPRFAAIRALKPNSAGAPTSV